VCRDFLEPATASVVHETLGLSANCQFFDLSNACLGVGNGMMLAGQLIESGALRAALVVAGENGQGLVESTIQRLLDDPAPSRKSIKKDFASLTIGSGGAAVLLAHEDLAPSAPRLLGGESRSATQHNRLCRGGAVGHSDTGVDSTSALDMDTDSEALLHAGVELAQTLWASFSSEFGFADAAPDKTITHQVGRAHTKALYEALSLDPERGFTTYDGLGNVGSVSLPITLAMASEAGFLEAGDDIALLGIGSGLSSLMMRVRW
jgi:3-oxoacyl-[acyl-carrier-protein] synthase-3